MNLEDKSDWKSYININPQFQGISKDGLSIVATYLSLKQPF